MMGWRGCEHTPVDRRCPLWETLGPEKTDWRGATGETPDARTRLRWALDVRGELGPVFALVKPVG